MVFVSKQLQLERHSASGGCIGKRRRARGLFAMFCCSKYSFFMREIRLWTSSSSWLMNSWSPTITPMRTMSTYFSSCSLSMLSRQKGQVYLESGMHTIFLWVHSFRQLS